MEKIRLAFCPTMTPFAQDIRNNIDTVQLLPGNSAAMVLQMLKRGMVESVLIGRTAKSYELGNGIKYKRLKEGITLIYKDKTSIYKDKLKDIPVMTYLNKDSLGKIANYFTKIAYTKSRDDCLNGDLSIPILIDWRDFRDSFELLIPIDERGKLPEFRAPIIYYSEKVNNDLIENIYKIINSRGD